MNYLLNDLSQKISKYVTKCCSHFQINITVCTDVTQNEIFPFNLNFFHLLELVKFLCILVLRNVTEQLNWHIDCQWVLIFNIHSSKAD